MSAAHTQHAASGEVCLACTPEPTPAAHTFVTQSTRYDSATLADGRRCQRQTYRSGSVRYYVETLAEPRTMRIVAIGNASMRARIDAALTAAGVTP